MPEADLRRKRAACENCRTRKVKCCGQTPCSACKKQLLQCKYKDQQGRRRTHSSRITQIRLRQHTDGRQFGTVDAREVRQEPLPGQDGENHNPDEEPHNHPNHGVTIQWLSGGSLPWNDRSPRPISEGNPSWAFPDNESQRTVRSEVTSWGQRSNQQPMIDSPMVGHNMSTTTSFQSDLLGQDSLPLPTFGSGATISCSLQQPQSSKHWPAEIDEASLLPWLDAYFKRLNIIVPVLSHISVYEAMLLGRHRVDQHFGAMILAMCSIVMIQCVYTDETHQLEERTKTARSLMQSSARMRSSWDFGQDATIETILTSFFLFGCLFSDGQERAAWHQLRLAVDMGCQIGIDQFELYSLQSKQQREQRMRIYLTLAVTERACALMRRRSIGLRGRPWSISLSALQASMNFGDLAFDSDDGQSVREITGLLCLARVYDSVDEDILDCWNGRCRKTDDICDKMDRREMLTVTRRVMTAANDIFPSDVSTAAGSALMTEAQRIDVLISQLWILNRLWYLSMSHNLLQSSSEHPVLTPEFAVAIASATSIICQQTQQQSIEVHGMGIFEKISDISSGVQSATELAGEARIIAYLAGRPLTAPALGSCVELWRRGGIDTTNSPLIPEQITSVLNKVLNGVRHGRHRYTKPQVP